MPKLLRWLCIPSAVLVSTFACYAFSAPKESGASTQLSTAAASSAPNQPDWGELVECSASPNKTPTQKAAIAQLYEAMSKWSPEIKSIATCDDLKKYERRQDEGARRRDDFFSTCKDRLKKEGIGLHECAESYKKTQKSN